MLAWKLLSVGGRSLGARPAVVVAPLCALAAGILVPRAAKADSETPMGIDDAEAILAAHLGSTCTDKCAPRVAPDEQAYKEAQAVLQAALPPPCPARPCAATCTQPESITSPPAPPNPRLLSPPPLPPHDATLVVGHEEYTAAENILRTCLSRSEPVGTSSSTVEPTASDDWARHGSDKISAALRQAYSDATSLLSHQLGGESSSESIRGDTPGATSSALSSQ